MSLFFLLPTGTAVLSSVPELNNMPVPIEHTIGFDASNRPVVGLRFSGLEGQSGGANNPSSPSYIQFGDDWLPDGGTASDYEVNVTDSSTSGPAGTKGGSATGSWLGMGTVRSWTYTKDSVSTGTPIWNISVTIREIADTGNSVTQATSLRPIIEP